MQPEVLLLGLALGTPQSITYCLLLSVDALQHCVKRLHPLGHSGHLGLQPDALRCGGHRTGNRLFQLVDEHGNLTTDGLKGFLGSSGTDTLSVTVNDQGNTGTGGAKTKSDSLSITITTSSQTPPVYSVESLEFGTDGGTGVIADVRLYNQVLSQSQITALQTSAAPLYEISQTVEYIYDLANRRIGKEVDQDGDGMVDHRERYVWDVVSPDGKGNVVLDFVDEDLDGEAEGSELSRRYLWGNMVDQLFAQENVDDLVSAAAADVDWMLTDNLGTIRDVVRYDEVSGTTSVAEHFTFGAFGDLTSGDASITRYLFTGQEYDADLGLYYYDQRWYDAGTGQFLSPDPVEDDRENTYRYVGNNPTNAMDPTGLEDHVPSWHTAGPEKGQRFVNVWDSRGKQLGKLIYEPDHFIDGGRPQIDFYATKLGKEGKSFGDRHLPDALMESREWFRVPGYQRSVRWRTADGKWLLDGDDNTQDEQGFRWYVEQNNSGWGYRRPSTKQVESHTQWLQNFRTQYEQGYKEGLEVTATGAQGVLQYYALYNTPTDLMLTVSSLPENPDPEQILAAIGVAKVNGEMAGRILLKLSSKVGKTGGVKQAPRVAEGNNLRHYGGAVDTRYINHAFGPSKLGNNRTKNCLNCALATDSTWAGNAATALPRTSWYPRTYAEGLRIIEKSIGNGRSFTRTSLGSLRTQVSNAGPGARGIVTGIRADRTAHAFNVINKNGVVHFFDGQSNQAITNLSQYNLLDFLPTNF